MSKCIGCPHDDDVNDSICFQCYLDDCEDTSERDDNATSSTHAFAESEREN